jgi:hypothetical protein
MVTWTAAVSRSLVQKNATGICQATLARYPMNGAFDGVATLQDQ